MLTPDQVSKWSRVNARHPTVPAPCRAPCQVVLLQELERWNALVTAMATSLQDLQRALSGEVGFSGPLEELSAALANGSLPPAWARLTPPTQKPLGAWMAWFRRRHAQYAAWVEGGEPKVMWLAGLHTPETYLAALVQAACRDKGWPLDRSRLYTQVTRHTDAAQVHERPRWAPGTRCCCEPGSRVHLGAATAWLAAAWDGGQGFAGSLLWA